MNQNRLKTLYHITAIPRAGGHKQNFKKNLKEILEKFSITQTKLAERTGIQISNISHFIMGRRTPSLQTIYKLKHALGCTYKELLG